MRHGLPPQCPPSRPGEAVPAHPRHRCGDRCRLWRDGRPARQRALPPLDDRGGVRPGHRGQHQRHRDLRAARGNLEQPALRPAFHRRGGVQDPALRHDRHGPHRRHAFRRTADAAADPWNAARPARPAHHHRLFPGDDGDLRHRAAGHGPARPAHLRQPRPGALLPAESGAALLPVRGRGRLDRDRRAARPAARAPLSRRGVQRHGRSPLAAARSTSMSATKSWSPGPRRKAGPRAARCIATSR